MMAWNQSAQHWLEFHLTASMTRPGIRTFEFRDQIYAPSDSKQVTPSHAGRVPSRRDIMNERPAQLTFVLDVTPSEPVQSAGNGKRASQVDFADHFAKRDSFR
jgi:hypothetical protein